MKVNKTPFCIYGLYFLTFFVFISLKMAKIQKCIFPQGYLSVEHSRKCIRLYPYPPPCVCPSNIRIRRRVSICPSVEHSLNVSAAVSIRQTFDKILYLTNNNALGVFEMPSSCDTYVPPSSSDLKSSVAVGSCVGTCRNLQYRIRATGGTPTTGDLCTDGF